MRRGMQFADQFIELAQIFAAAFFRFQFSAAHERGQIANFVLAFARKFVRMRVGDGSDGFGEMNLEPGRIGAQSCPQIAPQRGQFFFEMPRGRSAFAVVFRSL